MRLACSTGLTASDDLGYSHYAQLIAQYRYVPESHHFALRYGLTIPVAAAYLLFGVTEWATILVPFLASVASVPLLMIIGWKLFGARVALMAGLLFATFPVQLRYATILVPEPVAELYILLAIVVYLHIQGKDSLLLAIVTGVCVGVAYLTKEVAVFVVLALMIDAGARHKWRAVQGMVLGLTIIVAVEHAYYLILTGDLLFRPHAMVVHNQSPMALIANENLYYRLLKSYPRMMLLPNLDFGLHSTLSLAAVVLGLFLLTGDRLRLPVLWAFLPGLYLNFGSSSLTSYFALPVADRYIEFVYPPLFLMTGAVLDRSMSACKSLTPVAVVTLAMVAAIGFSCGFVTRAQGWRTDDVSVLRLIAKKAREKQLSSVLFVGDQENVWRWKRAMAILAYDVKVVSDVKTPAIVVRTDVFGLPSVARTVHEQ
jgi:hypothetical protein